MQQKQANLLTWKQRTLRMQPRGKRCSKCSRNKWSVTKWIRAHLTSNRPNRSKHELTQCIIVYDNVQPQNYITGTDEFSDPIWILNEAKHSFNNKTKKFSLHFMLIHCNWFYQNPIRWVAELRYLVVFIVRARTFRCLLSYAKCSFFGAVNGLFGKLLNLASETAILELVRSQCTPILLYGLESCQLSNADLCSLDFC